MATMSTSCAAAPTARMPILRTSFRGEKLGSSSLSGSMFCNGAREAGYPFRVSPQKLQVQAMKRIKGKVVCSSNDKTVSVEVVRLYTHPKYKKRVKSSKKYHAHDEENRCQVGDFVTLVSCAPVSKTKKFMVSEVVPKREAAPEETVDLEIMKPLEIAIAKLRAATKAAKS